MSRNFAGKRGRSSHRVVRGRCSTWMAVIAWSTTATTQMADRWFTEELSGLSGLSAGLLFGAALRPRLRRQQRRRIGEVLSLFDLQARPITTMPVSLAKGVVGIRDHEWQLLGVLDDAFAAFRPRWLRDRTGQIGTNVSVSNYGHWCAARSCVQLRSGTPMGRFYANGRETGLPSVVLAVPEYPVRLRRRERAAGLCCPAVRGCRFVGVWDELFISLEWETSAAVFAASEAPLQ